MLGRIINVGMTMEGNPEVLFQLNDKSILNNEKLRTGELLEVTLKPYRQRRSLNANNYAWALMTRIAEALGGQKDELEIYHRMLMRYGVREQADGEAVIISIKAEVDLEKTNEWLYIHSMPIGRGEANGSEFIHYYLLRGSSKYDTAEMSRFLDGIISEAKGLDIDTLTPEELERLNGYEVNYSK